jgi:hypothetical protein
MKNSLLINYMRIHRQKTFCIKNLNHRIFFELDLWIVWQWCLSLNYTLLIRLFRLISWSTWLEWLFDDNEWWVILVIVKLQRAFMMSEYWSCKMKFYLFHLEHDSHVFRFVSCVLFTKNFLEKRLIEIKMSFVSKMYVLLKRNYRFDHMTIIIFNFQLFILFTKTSDWDHSISIDFFESSLAYSLHCTSRTIQLKMIYLHLSRLILYEIFVHLQHLIQLINRHFDRSFWSIFTHTTRCCRFQFFALM